MYSYDVEKNMEQHNVGEKQKVKMRELRDIYKQLATYIDELVAPSREKSLSLTRLEESLFWVNASISRNEEGS